MAFNNRNRSLLSLVHHTDRDLLYLLDLSRDLKRAKYSGVGRTSLAIGITFLALSLVAGDFAAKLLRNTVGELLRESLLIGGWVAMWRPMEMFLYDWWPIRSEAKLLDRLSEMPVRIAYTADASSEAWRWDWPAVSPSEKTPRPPDSPSSAQAAQLPTTRKA